MTSLDNQVTVRVPQTATETSQYWILMNCVNPPAAAPTGYRFLSSSYSLWGSGYVTGTQVPLVLNMFYALSQVGTSDPQTISIFHWNAGQRVWQDTHSTQLGNELEHWVSIDTFGIYALLIKAEKRPLFLPLI